MPNKKKVEEWQRCNSNSRHLNSLLVGDEEYQKVETEGRKFLCLCTTYPIVSLFSGRRIDSVDGPLIIAEIIGREVIPIDSGDGIKKVCSISWEHFETGIGGSCRRYIYDQLKRRDLDISELKREHCIDLDILFQKE